MTPDEQARALILGCCQQCGTPRVLAKYTFAVGENPVACPNCYPDEVKK